MNSLPSASFRASKSITDSISDIVRGFIQMRLTSQRTCYQVLTLSALSSQQAHRSYQNTMIYAMSELNRRSFCRTLAAIPAALQSAPAPTLPNIVYILADDLGWGDLGCYNSQSAVPTPNADRFATQGLRFTDMHSASAVCTPTRYGILTGRYCWRSNLNSGVLLGYSPTLIQTARLTPPTM